jgi:hypothetical protein
MTHQIRVEVSADHVATVEFENGARNHFDAALIAGLADTFERLDADGRSSSRRPRTSLRASPRPPSAGSRASPARDRLAGAFAVVDPIDGAVNRGCVAAGQECDHVRHVEGLHHAAR